MLKCKTATRTVGKPYSTEINDYEITVDILESYDPHYGVDADGNRSTGVWFTEEEIITKIHCMTTDILIDPKRLSISFCNKILERAK